MIDLIGGGIRRGVRDGREIVEIPSALFVDQCAETRRGWRPEQGPLPPD